MKTNKILIVGGSEGIGLGLVKEAITKYSSVTVMARNDSHQLKELPVKFINQDFDSTDKIESTFMETKADTVILCVAKGLYGDVLSQDNAEITNCIKSTYISSVLWIKESVKFLPEYSRLAWISSLTAKINNLDWAVYSSAKAGVEHFISSIREKATQRKISITVCYPGCVKTDFHEKAGARIPREAIEASDIASELLSAVENRLPFWSAPSDSKIVADFYQNSEILQNKFKNSLK